MDKDQWTRIQDPNGSQKKLFESSKAVYQQLFEPQHREKFSHFRDYILDAEESRRSGDTDGPLDSYYVGRIGSETMGMALVTGYENHRLGIISYFGVLSPDTYRSKLLAGRGLKTIEEEFWNRGIQAYLIEVERISLAQLKDLESKRKLHKWTKMRHGFLKTIQSERIGARKISCINYLQPVLDVDLMGIDKEAADLHLMVASTAPTMNADEYGHSADRNTIKKYINFMYNVFYMDGFESSDDFKSQKKARQYLSRLSRQILRDLPPQLEYVPLGEVALKPFGAKAMVSYKVGEGDQLRLLLCRYLTDLGVDVINWAEGVRVGKRLRRAIFEMVQSSDVFIPLLTPAFLTSKPMQEELTWAVDMEKHVLPLVDGDTNDGTKQKIIRLLEKILEGRLVYLEFKRQRFDETVYAIREQLREKFPQDSDQ